MKTATKPYTLTGAGTEIDNFNVEDTYESYIVTGTAVAIGNYAISITGTPQQGERFVVQWNGTLDITTGSKTFSILGTSLTQAQLNSQLIIICVYDGAAWEVSIIGSLAQMIIQTANIANLAVTTAKIAASAVTATELAANAVTTAKVLNNNITNAKLAQATSYSILGNNTGSTANVTYLPISTVLNSSAWRINGNSGTVAGTNFLGTTDNIDLMFKVWNTQSGIISPGSSTTSFGLSTLESLTSGVANTAFGDSALDNVTSGGGNVGIGSNSFTGVISGSNNVGIGQSVGATLSSGSNNTVIGDSAGVTSATSLNRVALGSGASADADYQFALADDIIKFKFRGVSYTLPATDGTAGQALLTDGAGTLYWG